MPQEHQVLRCFTCEAFQAHIVKKAKKWECKMCGTKQSFKRNYGKGSGKDCRAQVMKLNELRMHQNEPPSGVENMDEDEDEAISIGFDNFNESFEPARGVNKSIKPPLKSKWSEFLDKIDESNEDDEQEFQDSFMWEGSSNNRKRQRNDCNWVDRKKNNFDMFESKENDFESFENKEINCSDEITNYEDYEIENTKTEFKHVKKELGNGKKRENSTNSKWNKYSEYLQNDSEEFEEPKPKKILRTFNQITDDNLDEILAL